MDLKSKRRHLREDVQYTREMEERKLFMEELKKFRSQNTTSLHTEINTSIGPKWYQVLSTNQRKVLDTLDDMVYQDLLEGEPVRIKKILRNLGITYYELDKVQLLSCMYLGRNDPKDVLSNLYFEMFDRNVAEKLKSYELNGRIILSGIFYLGFRKLIEQLEDIFKPDTVPPKIQEKLPKLQKRCKAISPYLEKIDPPFYQPAKPKRERPRPLPKLDFLNDNQYEEEPILTNTPPPPPPPPAPPLLKRRSRTHCDQLAGITNIDRIIVTRKKKKSQISLQTPKVHKKLRASKLCLTENKKKVYGIHAKTKKIPHQQIPVAPTTNASNLHYMISGVYFYGMKTFFIVGGLALTPPDGDLLIGGHALVDGNHVRIIESYREHTSSTDTSCNCIEKWDEAASQYIRQNKCSCKHFYDYGNEGTFPQDEPTYFDKPTKKAPYKFNHDLIYEIDPKVMHLKKEMKRVWETESLLLRPEETQKLKKKKKRNVLRNTSVTCLGNAPCQDDYLRCALQMLKQDNLAARLPDIHLAPELKTWMHRRIFGDYTSIEKNIMFEKCIKYWNYLSYYQSKVMRAAKPDKASMSRIVTTWKYKPKLQREFKEFIHTQKYKAFKAEASYDNLLWASMCQAQLPNKRFRDIFFCYVVPLVTDMHFVNPFSSQEAEARRLEIKRRRRICSRNSVNDLK